MTDWLWTHVDWLIGGAFVFGCVYWIVALAWLDD